MTLKRKWAKLNSVIYLIWLIPKTNQADTNTLCSINIMWWWCWLHIVLLYTFTKYNKLKRKSNKKLNIYLYGFCNIKLYIKWWKTWSIPVCISWLQWRDLCWNVYFKGFILWFSPLMTSRVSLSDGSENDSSSHSTPSCNEAPPILKTTNNQVTILIIYWLLSLVLMILKYHKRSHCIQMTLHLFTNLSVRYCKWRVLLSRSSRTRPKPWNVTRYTSLFCWFFL